MSAHTCAYLEEALFGFDVEASQDCFCSVGSIQTENADGDYMRADSCWGRILAEEMFCGFLFLGRRIFSRILSPDFFASFCEKKCPEKSSRKIPGKILQILCNKNPRHISAEGPGQHLWYHLFVVVAPFVLSPAQQRRFNWFLVGREGGRGFGVALCKVWPNGAMARLIGASVNALFFPFSAGREFPLLLNGCSYFSRGFSWVRRRAKNLVSLVASLQSIKEATSSKEKNAEGVRDLGFSLRSWVLLLGLQVDCSVTYGIW